jgi:putative Holliday junction resolvase
MKYLGIDYGSKRVGVAISDDDGVFAFPHAVIARTGALEAIAVLCKERTITGIVIGESNNFQGTANPIQEDIQKFATALTEKTKLPVILEPEYYTSAEASRLQGENGMHDASAAALILKSYLDKKK